jgi:4-hydroxy-3-methylbut-2-enyl diphosphate reductase
MELVLARPRGFCAGVTRAIEIVERALELHGAPVYVFHEIVHNQHVVHDLEVRGAIFVDDIAAIPRGSVTVLSAHGVARAIEREADRRGLQVIDATCPLVAKVHLQVQRFARQAYHVVLIGHAGHDEVVGTVGKIDETVHVVASLADIERLPMPSDARVAYVTQTTLSVDDTRDLIEALTRRYPHLVGPEIDDICYATQNRQVAVKQLADEVDVVLVVGAPNSSNTHRLQEVAAQKGKPSFRIAHAGEIDHRWFAGVQRVGITAGASAPEYLVEGVRNRLYELGAVGEREIAALRENVMFRLPAAVLRRRPAHAPEAPPSLAVQLSR